MSSVLLVLTFKPWEWNQASNESKTCSIVAMSWQGSLFCRRVEFGYRQRTAPRAPQERKGIDRWQRSGKGEGLVRNLGRRQ